LHALQLVADLGALLVERSKELLELLVGPFE